MGRSTSGEAQTDGGVSLGSIDEAELRCPSPPLIAGQHLHVLGLVGLIGDLEPEKGLDHVFHRDDACGASVVVDDERDVLAPLNKTIKRLEKRVT